MTIAPRLVCLADARKRLGGAHPSAFGIPSIGKGRAARWDLKAIDDTLDRLSGLKVDRSKGAANDDDEGGELAFLARKIDKAYASRRT